MTSFGSLKNNNDRTQEKELSRARFEVFERVINKIVSKLPCIIPDALSVVDCNEVCYFSTLLFCGS